MSKLRMQLRTTGKLTPHCFTFGHEICKGLLKSEVFLLTVVLPTRSLYEQPDIGKDNRPRKTTRNG
jgi:hypothetical protein